jgi:hypothetical protein
MSVSSILLIRKLCDPSPELLSFGARSGVVPPAWQQGVRDSVGEFMRLAARPAAGELTNCENAVLFMDRAELLACLAHDWCNYRIVERWWWRALLRNDYSFWTTWIRNPEYVPAAIAQLARSHAVTRFAAALTESEARLLTQRVIEAFALTALRETFEWLILRAPVRDQPEQSNANQVSRHSDLEGHAPQVRAPWRGVLQEAAAVSLPLPQQLFVGLALMIHQAPSVVRTARFARDVAQWHRQQFKAESEVTQAGKPEAQLTSATAFRVPDLAPLDNRAAPPEIQSNHYQNECADKFELSDQSQSSVAPLERLQVTDREVHEFPESKSLSGELHRAGADQLVQNSQVIRPNEVSSDLLREKPQSISSFQPASVDENDEREVQRVATGNEVTDSTGLTEADSESLTSQSMEAETYAVVEVETNLGGFIYLINLALYLDLYGDFTRPTEAGIKLNIWDFVTLVGTDLTGDRFGTDPIFDLLATLAGREPQAEVGEDFAPPEQWRLPVEWLSVFDTKQGWRWNVVDDRLCVCHANGFPVLDLAVGSADVKEQLSREIDPYRHFFLGLERSDLRIDPVNLKLRTSSATQLWLSRLLPYVRARLRAALGPGAPSDPGPFLCRQNAIVRATETHVEVFFNLGEHPIELRLAGLDRDPGWVPAAGRFISFHYN